MSGSASEKSFWDLPFQYSFHPADSTQVSQQFEFQTYSDQQYGNYTSYEQEGLLDSVARTFGDDNRTKGEFVDEEKEPPLLEELEIYPDRILQKILFVLNPFRRRGQIDDANCLLEEADITGPVTLCLLFAAFLFLAGSKTHLGYVYGLAVTSCAFMFILQSLMSDSPNVTLYSVVSILGYCLLPVVILAGISIFIILRGPIGFVLAAIAVMWASISASRVLTTLSGEEDQRLLIAYPCALLYGVFTLIVIF